MAKNRRIPKRKSVVVSSTMRVGAVLGILFVMVILNLLASSRCQQLMKAIGEDEKELGRLEDARMREATRWEEMKTPEKIEAALIRNGLSMKPARADQIVHMRSSGQPYPGQVSVAKARQRQTQVASISTTASAGVVRPNARRMTAGR